MRRSFVKDELLRLFGSYTGEELKTRKIVNKVRNSLKRKNIEVADSIRPPDWCYNKVNAGIKYKKNRQLFECIDDGLYLVLGINYDYTKELYWEPKKATDRILVGEWKKGKLYVNKAIAIKMNRASKQGLIVFDLENPWFKVIEDTK